MFVMLCVLVLVFHQLQFIAASSGVAPGNEESSMAFCKNLRLFGTVQKLSYSANVEVLMDSLNYENLLPPRSEAVWQQVDKDMNNPVGVTTNWIQNSNSPCQQTAQVCGFSAGMQNNWLITQLINRTVNGTRLPQVSVMIEFEQRDCDVTLMCQRTFNTHVYEKSSVNSTAARNTVNYRQVQRVSPDDTSGAKVNETIDINFNTNHSSFYFAIQDETSCMVITRLVIFYHICPSETAEMIVHPKTVAPLISRRAVPLLITASCVDNASPIHSGAQGPKVKCNEGGIWSLIPDLGCKCNLGYVPSVDRRLCEVCPVGQYFSTYTSSCEDCPENSVFNESDTVRLDSCTCHDGTFLPRNADTNGSCVTVDTPEMKPKKSSTNLTVVLPTTLVLVGVSLVFLTSLYLCKQRNRRGRVYRVNELAPWQNEETSNQEGDATPERRDRERPNQLGQTSTSSTRSSAPSLKWNMAYFLFKILGPVQSPVTPQPSTHTATPGAALNGNSGTRASSESPSEKVDDIMLPMNSFNSSDEDAHDYVNAHITCTAAADLEVSGEEGTDFKSVDFSEWDSLNIQSQNN